MNYQGEGLGGFAGSTHGAVTSKQYSISNCYAAGEVGSIDTDFLTVADCGGFIGNIGTGYKVVTSNCYYDMQTTAMKNKAVGSISPLSMTRDISDGGVSTSTWNGIKGLTTNKMTGAAASSLFSSGYVFTPGLYPQLSTMASSARQLDRAQSAASTATVFCDNWSDIAPATGFDTVRDTIRNYAFSSVEDFDMNTQFSSAHVTCPSVSSISWSVDDNISPIDGATPIIALTDGPYYTTSMSPGIEWAEVSLNYVDDGGNAFTGSRRLRLIPTSKIEAGGDKRIDITYDQSGGNVTESYDHKSGFATTYLDSTTLLSYLQSSSAHPEALITFDQLENAQYTDNVITGTAELPFNSRTEKLEVSATVTREDGTPVQMSELYGKLNGERLFEDSDCGIYRIAYRSTLDDGRYLTASKKLVAVSAWSVVYNYNYSGTLGEVGISEHSIFYVQSNLADFEEYSFADYEHPPLRVGYSFAYWSLDAEGLRPVSQKWFDDYEERYGALADNIDVYAQWNRKIEPIHTLVIDPGIGSYDTALGEKISFTGGKGDRVIIDDAVAPDKWTFVEWSGNVLGGGELVKSDTGCWIFTFGDGDAEIAASYSRYAFEVTVRKVSKLSGNDLAEPWSATQNANDTFSIDVAEGIDPKVYVVDEAAVSVRDADTGEEVPLSELGFLWTDGGNNPDFEAELSRSFSYIMPKRNIEIIIAYDTFIQMPETGKSGIGWVVFAGMVCLLAAASASWRASRRNADIE